MELGRGPEMDDAIQGILASLAGSRVWKGIVKYLAGGILGLTILAWAAVHSGPAQEEVIVHVTEPGVEVMIGGRTFQIEDRRYNPIVCHLPPGWHDLVMKRHGRVVYRESFEVRRGFGLVLTALDPNRSRSDPDLRRTREGFGMPLADNPGNDVSG